MREIKLGVSPITNEIYAGYVNKTGDVWVEKQEVTIQVLMATVRHILAFGEPVIISKENGEPEFEIIVKELKNAPTKIY